MENNIRIPNPDEEPIQPPIGPPFPTGPIYFDYQCGDKVLTIFEETGFIEVCAIQRSGIKMYLVQTTMKENAWLEAGQIKQLLENAPYVHMDLTTKQQVKPMHETIGFKDKGD